MKAEITERPSDSTFGLFFVPTALIFCPAVGQWCRHNCCVELKTKGCIIASQLAGWRCICLRSKSSVARNIFPYGLWGYGSRKVIFFSELAFFCCFVVALKL